MDELNNTLQDEISESFKEQDNPPTVEEVSQNSLLKDMNPFAFNSDDASLYGVKSIEDFYIRVRKQDYTLDEFIRRSDFSLGKRKRLSRKRIKRWVYEFKHSSDATQFIVKDERPSETKKKQKFLFGSYILLLLSTAILFVQAFGSIILGANADDVLEGGEIAPNFFEKIGQGLTWVRDTNIGSYIVFIGLYISISAWAVIGLFTVIKRLYVKTSSTKAKVSNSLGSGLEKVLRKKSKKTLRYYKKIFKEEYINDVDPLPIEETSVMCGKFEESMKYNAELTSSAALLKKKYSTINVLRVICTFGSYICALVAFIYGIIMAYIK